MKDSAESFFVYMLVAAFAGFGILPLAAFAGGVCSFLVVLAVSPVSFYAAFHLYAFEERRELQRRRKALNLRMISNKEPLKAA